MGATIERQDISINGRCLGFSKNSFVFLVGKNVMFPVRAKRLPLHVLPVIRKLDVVSIAFIYSESMSQQPSGRPRSPAPPQVRSDERLKDRPLEKIAATEFHVNTRMPDVRDECFCPRDRWLVRRLRPAGLAGGVLTIRRLRSGPRSHSNRRRGARVAGDFRLPAARRNNPRRPRESGSPASRLATQSRQWATLMPKFFGE